MDTTLYFASLLEKRARRLYGPKHWIVIRLPGQLRGKRVWEGNSLQEAHMELLRLIHPAAMDTVGILYTQYLYQPHDGYYAIKHPTLGVIQGCRHTKRQPWTNVIHPYLLDRWLHIHTSQR